MGRQVTKKIWRSRSEDQQPTPPNAIVWGQEVVSRAEFMDAFRHAQEAVAKPLHEISTKMDRLIDVTSRHDERLESVTESLTRGEVRMATIERSVSDVVAERHACQRDLARRHTQQDEMRQELDDLGERVCSLEVVRHRAGGWLSGWDWLKGAGAFGALWAAWEILHKTGGK